MERKFPQSVLSMNYDRNDRCKGYFHHDKLFAPQRIPHAGSGTNAAECQCTGTEEGTTGKGSAGGSRCSGSTPGPSGARRAAISGSTKSRRIATSGPAAGRSAATRSAKNRRAGA
jgi:hypothetical protein